MPCRTHCLGKSESGEESQAASHMRGASRESPSSCCFIWCILRLLSVSDATLKTELCISLTFLARGDPGGAVLDSGFSGSGLNEYVPCMWRRTLGDRGRFGAGSPSLKTSWPAMSCRRCAEPLHAGHLAATWQACRRRSGGPPCSQTWPVTMHHFCKKL